MQSIVNNIFSADETSFNALAFKIFEYQLSHNVVYRQWIKALKRDTKKITQLRDIPFLPISFFKTHNVVTGDFVPQQIFESSGTSQQLKSRHIIKDTNVYMQSFTKGFEKFYGNIEDWCIVALLPSYLERDNSSLVMMAEHLMKLSAHPSSGFYLYDHEKLYLLLSELESSGQKILLIGVTFALLDFAEQYPMKLKHTIVMETGGMKGRREEITREEVHDILKHQLQTPAIHSEYGMTELLSQAYSNGEGTFECVPWMKVLVRNEEDPLQVEEHGQGILNIIDFANIHSCSFIATDDAGIISYNTTFKVTGRVDHSDIRGCSLLAV